MRNCWISADRCDTFSILIPFSGYKQTRKNFPHALRGIEDPSQDLFLIVVSLWEMAIKLRSGRLDIGGRSATDVLNAARNMSVKVISLDPDEAATHGSLIEDTHFDRFDRMLIWQAISRKMILVSGDKEFERFIPDGLKLLWK